MKRCHFSIKTTNTDKLPSLPIPALPAWHAAAATAGSISTLLLLLLLLWPGFVPFFKNNFPALFQDFFRTQIHFSRAPKCTIIKPLQNNVEIQQ